MSYSVGLDIGGANLKAARADGTAKSVAFPVWRQPDALAGALRELIADWLPDSAGLAVTMTAELADCFTSRDQGVRRVLDAVLEVSGGRPVVVWQTAGEFVSPEVAREFPELTAAANWHALATFAGRIVPHGTALLIDVGSTTTDLIPLVDGLPDSRGRTDIERMKSGELVYTGVRRTPVCALTDSVLLQDELWPLAAEVFATTLDVYLLTGDLSESPDDHDTANGRAGTITEAHNRLARQFCGDRSDISRNEVTAAAEFLADLQECRILAAADQVVNACQEPPSAVVISGAGSFLANRVVDRNPVLRAADRYLLSDLFSPETATAACAFALARLADEGHVLIPTDASWTSLLE